MKKFLFLIPLILFLFSGIFIPQEVFSLTCEWEECSSGGDCETASDCSSSRDNDYCKQGTCYACNEHSETCPSDGWHSTGSTRWVSTGECGEKEQEEEEWRGYWCPQCRYNVFETRWSDTGRTREDDSICASSNYTYCSGDRIREKRYTCSGASCSFDRNVTIKDCSDDDYKYCSGDDVRERHHTCSSSSCVDDGSSHVEDCSDRDGWYCGSSHVREYRDYTCSGGGCSYTVTNTKDCRDYGDRSFCSSRECQSIPEAYNLRTDDPDPEECCSMDYPPITLLWDYNSQTNHNQTAYSLQISDDSEFNNVIRQTGKTNCSHPCTNSYPVYDLNFNETYYFRVKVWDSRSNESEWFAEEFETDYERATPDFRWLPPSPRIEELTSFYDLTEEGHFPIESWRWEFEDGDPESSDQQNPKTEFTGSRGVKEVRLEVEDSDGVSCDITKEIRLREIMPDWRERAPFSLLVLRNLHMIK